MIATLNEVLPAAREGGYAVGLFNTTDSDMLDAVIEAAEAERAPVVIGTAEILLPYGELSLIAPSMIAAAKRASVPVVVHYDHGLTFDRCIEALRLGFSSIMYDGSLNAPEENLAATREIVKIAHAFGATVEICDLPGSEALRQDPGLNDLSSRVLDELVGREHYGWNRQWAASSTDMGDISALFPAIHPYAGGAIGAAHGSDYGIADPEQACVQSAVFQTLLIAALLENDAAEAKKIMAGFTPVFESIDAYVEHKKSMAMNKNTVTFCEDGTIKLDFQS